MIYLLRHGLDDESFVGGWSNVDLIDEGIKQVEDISDYIRDNIKINKIYSSDIKRAVTTSNIVSKKINVEVEYTDMLREQNKGLANGISKKEAKEKFNFYINSNDVNLKYPNGESLKDLYDRVKSNMHLLEDMNDTLIVTHRGVINMFYYILNDIPLDMKKSRFGVSHASLHVLDLKNRTIRKVE